MFYPEERFATAMDVEGIRLERLFPYKDGNLLESTIHLVAPGAGIDPISHQGEELGYMLDGEIALTVDGKVYQVPAGASLAAPGKDSVGEHATDFLKVGIRSAAWQ